jgi:hypothetical protein
LTPLVFFYFIGIGACCPLIRPWGFNGRAIPYLVFGVALAFAYSNPIPALELGYLLQSSPALRLLRTSRRVTTTPPITARRPSGDGVAAVVALSLFPLRGGTDDAVLMKFWGVSGSTPLALIFLLSVIGTPQLFLHDKK